MLAISQQPDVLTLDEDASGPGELDAKRPGTLLELAIDPHGDRERAVVRVVVDRLVGGGQLAEPGSGGGVHVVGLDSAGGRNGEKQAQDQEAREGLGDQGSGSVALEVFRING